MPAASAVDPIAAPMWSTVAAERTVAPAVLETADPPAGSYVTAAKFSTGEFERRFGVPPRWRRALATDHAWRRQFV